MATWTTSTAVGERESLADVIARIDPADTPAFSNAKKETTKAQELTAASDTNLIDKVPLWETALAA